jgi:ligand-binding sensor domain-containing protein
MQQRRILLRNQLVSILLPVMILLISAGKVCSQFAVYQHYTADDGLPSSEIFDIVQDSTGNIWFATGYGISRYDGYNFQTYTTRDGLPANSNVVAYIDYLGRPWFTSYEGYLCYVDQNRCIPYQWNDTVSALAGRYNIANVRLQPDGSLVFKPQKINKLYQIDSLGIVKEIEPPTNPENRYHLYFTQDTLGVVWDFMGTPEYQRQIPTRISRKGDTLFLRFSINRFPSLLRPRYQLIDSTSMILSAYNKLWQIENDEVIREKQFENNINHQLLDPYGNLWIAVEYEGIYFFPARGSWMRPRHLFPGMNITKLFLDRERNIWIGTIEDGVYRVPAMQFSNFYLIPGTENMKITSLCRRDSLIYFSTYDKRLLTLNWKRDGLPMDQLDVGHISFAINDILLAPDNKLWLLGIDNLTILSEDSLFTSLAYPERISFFEGFFQNDTLWTGTSRGLLAFQKNKLVFQSSTLKFEEPVRCVYPGGDETILLGTFDGLFRFSDSTFHACLPKEEQIRSRITDILMMDETLICGTRSEGLILTSADTGWHLDLTRESGLSSNMINVLFSSQSNILWVGTNTGINRLDLSNRDSINHRITAYTKWDGLPVTKINDIIDTPGALWLATDQGLIVFSPEKLSKYQVAPKLSIDRIRINDKDTVITTEYMLAPDQNTVQIDFRGISLKDPGNVKYLYRLKGFDKEWVASQNPMVRYFMLPPGRYQFELMASGVDDQWNEEPVVLIFEIQTPLIRKWWFQLILGLSLLIAITLIFLLILRNQKKKMALQRNLILSEQKALRTQINPHFLFNALNSIQNLVFKGAEKEADYYLSNFSALMRKILENSKTNTIPLKEEIETLRLYIELEKMRFGDGFSFVLNIDPTLDQEGTEIPPMLIQPFLENAILHGLLPKEGIKTLIIKVMSFGEGSLKWVIEDNGIGRDRSKKLKSWRKTHKSTGQQNVEERLALMKVLYRKNFELNITDLQDQHKQPTGTRVEILMPFVIK